MQCARAPAHVTSSYSVPDSRSPRRPSHVGNSCLVHQKTRWDGRRGTGGCQIRRCSYTGGMGKRRIILAAVVLVLLAGIVTILWLVLDWPPPRLILKYGFPPTGGPTGNVRVIEGIEFVELSPGYFRMGSWDDGPEPGHRRPLRTTLNRGPMGAPQGPPPPRRQLR